MRYLIATDGSESSLEAARFFLEQSRPGAEDEIFVTYVFPLPTDPEFYDGVVSLPKHAQDERVVQVARPILAKTLEALSDAPSRVEEVVLVGNPAEEIVEFALNLGVDLIVAGTRGRSPEKEVYLGSVSSALTHRALCPVLVVRQRMTQHRAESAYSLSVGPHQPKNQGRPTNRRQPG
jgi:nucleotide-binding universal stress UspA family protein